MDPEAEIDALLEHEERQAGSDAERRAANHLRRRLEQPPLDRDARLEPFGIHPRYHLTHLVHALVAIAGSAIAVNDALVGLILVAVATAGALGDITGRARITRRLTGRRASQNVYSPAPAHGHRPGTIVLTAHLDASRTGAAFKRPYRIGSRTIGLAEPFAYALVLLLACTIAREAGIDSKVLSAIQFVPTVVLIVAVPYLADIALSSPVPGANDNASGVATVLRLADRYQDELDHFDVHVLLTGAQESGAEGMRAWLRRHRKGLDPLSTIVLNVDEVGAGTVVYARKEGALAPPRQHRQLTSLCDQIAQEDAERGRYEAKPTVRRGPSDAHAARQRGIPAITISCAPAPHHHRPTDTPENVDPEALERAYGFCSELIELIDEKIGPDVDARAREAAAEPFTPA